MNSLANRRWLVPLLVAAALAALLAWMQRQTPPPGNLEGSSLGSGFTLTDQNGRTVKDTDFAGKWRLVYFGYSFCPDICPTDLAAMARGYDKFAREHPDLADKVVPIFITLDPERDTPAQVKPFVAAFSPRLIGLSGPPAETARLARAFGISWRKVDTGDPANYLLDHASLVSLYGPQGQPLQMLKSGPGTAPADMFTASNVAATLARFVR
jgi:protein SCO1/2